MEAEKNLAHEILKEENQEEILRKAGCKDLIELMKCKNCLYYKDGKCLDSKLDMDANGHCAIWTENLGAKNALKEIYEELKNIIKQYMDIEESNIEIIALWIIGTWMHSSFPTYPYLFINAAKGSGKTRLLKLIKELSWEGDMLASLSEAVLFRTNGTLCIDEFENISGKDKNTLRELLNTAYKQGGKVKRMRKKKTGDGETQIVEEFPTFRPIVMANISGMEEILGDRCIPIVIEKSASPVITLKVEYFSNCYLIKVLKQKFALNDFKAFSVEVCSVDAPQNIYTWWNLWLDCLSYTLHTHTTHNTYTTVDYTNNMPSDFVNIPSIYLPLFEKLFKTGINGRNMELCLPLFLIANEIGILDKIISILQAIVNEKTETDFIGSPDVQLIDFISKQDNMTYYKISELCYMFKQFINYEPNSEEKDWLNNRWIGIALKRLNLIGKKRRLGQGIEVILNIKKAAEKIKMFK